MKFAWERESNNGVCQIDAEPGPYDGHPSARAFIVDAVPRTISSDRFAVAAVLAFGKYLNGPIAFPNSISPATAGAISAYLDPAVIHVEQIDFEPRRIEYGPNVFANYSTKDTSTQLCRVINFLELDIWNSFGSSFESNHLRVPTNRKLLSGFSECESSSWDQDLACMVLLSEDYGIGSIWVQESRRPEVARLLQSCGLALIVNSDN